MVCSELSYLLFYDTFEHVEHVEESQIDMISFNSPVILHEIRWEIYKLRQAVGFGFRNKQNSEPEDTEVKILIWKSLIQRSEDE